MADPKASSGSWLKINSSVSSPPLTALSPARSSSPTVANPKYLGSPLALGANNATTTPPNHAVISAALVAPRAQHAAAPPPSSLASSIDRLASFMSTSFPTSKKNNANVEQTLDSLKEDFERKIGSVVYCLQEKAEENIDLSNKIKSLQEQNRQKEAEKDKLIGELNASIKSKDDQAALKEKERSTLEEIVNEFTRRLQTITLCLNDMAEENLRLRNQLEEQSHPPQHQQQPQRASSAPKIVTQQPQQQQNTVKQSPHPSASIPPPVTPPTSTTSPTPPTTSPTPSHSSSSANPLLRTSSASISIRGRSASNVDTSPAASFTATPLSSATFLSTMLSSTPSTNTNATNTSSNTSSNSSSNKDNKQNVGTDISGLSNEDFTILVKDFLEDTDWLKKFGDTFLKGTSKEVVQLLSNIVEQDKTRHEKHVTAPLTDQLAQIDEQIKEQEEMMVELKSKLQKENDKATSLSDSVIEYEKKVKELESRMWDNLNKEAQRRGDAEFNAKRLKKKVEELQFLLDELKDESNSSLSESGTGEDDDESDDSDDDEEEKASKNNKSKAKT